jgi:DNA-directed RNA polymerase specialized sigma24 family protein
MLPHKLWRDLSFERMPDGWQEPPAAQSQPMVGKSKDGGAVASNLGSIAQVVRADLTVSQREVLNLVVINGVDSEEVAERLGMSPGGLDKMTHDARRKLRTGLLKRGFSTSEILGAVWGRGVRSGRLEKPIANGS